MRFTKITGMSVFFLAVSMVLAGGQAPKKEDVPKYLKQLSSPRAADRATAAEMLGLRGQRSIMDVAEAVEPLRNMMQKDPDVKARVAAARALGDIHTQAEETVPVLIERLKKDDKMEVKMAIVVTLGQYGPDAKDALPALRDFAKKFPAKKSTEGQAISNSIQLITMVKKKKG